LGFTYSATQEQLSAFCENLRYQLKQDKNIDPARIIVAFNSFGDSSLNVLVQFHYQLDPDQTDAKKIEDQLTLIAKVAAENKLEFAFPTRTLQIANAEAEKLKV
jgi:MscS family membrane protein